MHRRWADGFWDVTLTRKLDTGHPPQRQWLWTLAAGIALIAAFGIALNQLLSRKQGV